MAATIPTTEPAALHAGDSWAWTRTLADYPAGEGWVLSYVYTNASSRFTLTAGASGDDHAIAEDAADTAPIKPGKYAWAAHVTLADDRYTVDTGRLEVKPNLGAAQNFDTRSHARTVLESIEAVIERRATKDQEEYTIEGRSLKRTPIAELLVMRDRYRQEAANETAAEQLGRGFGNPRYIGTRFGRA